MFTREPPGPAEPARDAGASAPPQRGEAAADSRQDERVPSELAPSHTGTPAPHCPPCARASAGGRSVSLRVSAPAHAAAGSVGCALN